VSPPRRSRKPASAGRKPALGRQDLESLLAQIDALQSSRRTGSAGGGGTGGGRRAKADEVEIGRLRRLLADAIANDLNDDVSDEDEDDDWDEEPWDQDDPYDDEDEEGDWWPGGRWERFAPAKPIRVEGGLTTRSRRGAIGETWWSQRFLAAVEATTPGGRSTRGRSYARQGQVLELAVGAGLIEASVQGSRQTPYRVRLAMPVADDGEWDRLTVALAGQAGYAAQMLAGELPHEVEDVFAAEGVSLFPSRSSKLSTDCTCPDWANPCKHVAAVCYLVAEEFDRDPFAVLAWRGRGRDAVLQRLRELRGIGREGSADAGGTTPTERSASAEGSGPTSIGDDTGPTAPPLEDSVLGFWKAGPELADVHLRPEAAELAGAVLRHLPRGLLDVRGRDVAELLEPAYVELAAAAARRALGDDGPDRF